MRSKSRLELSAPHENSKHRTELSPHPGPTCWAIPVGEGVGRAEAPASRCEPPGGPARARPGRGLGLTHLPRSWRPWRSPRSRCRTAAGCGPPVCAGGPGPACRGHTWGHRSCRRKRSWSGRRCALPPRRPRPQSQARGAEPNPAGSRACPTGRECGAQAWGSPTGQTPGLCSPRFNRGRTLGAGDRVKIICGFKNCALFILYFSFPVKV